MKHLWWSHCIKYDVQRHKKKTTQFGWFSFCAVSMFTVATDGFPEHNCQALPVGYTAQGVVAQRSKFIGAPSRNKFWAPQECKQWLCHCAKRQIRCPRNHDRTLKMIQFLVSYFLSLQHRNKSSVQPRDRNN